MKKGRTDPDESAFRALAGTGQSALRGDTAMRGREVSKPTAEDLEAAEREVVIRHARRV